MNRILTKYERLPCCSSLSLRKPYTTCYDKIKYKCLILCILCMYVVIHVHLSTYMIQLVHYFYKPSCCTTDAATRYHQCSLGDYGKHEVCTREKCRSRCCVLTCKGTCTEKVFHYTIICDATHASSSQLPNYVHVGTQSRNGTLFQIDCFSKNAVKVTICLAANWNARICSQLVGMRRNFMMSLTD